MQTTKRSSYCFPFIALLCASILLLYACSNNMQDQAEEFVFPESLTIEKILGITWKADKESMHIITPANTEEFPEKLRSLYTIKDKLFNSIQLSKTGSVYVSYAARPSENIANQKLYDNLKNSIFYYEGKWTPNKNNKEELFVKIDSPMGMMEFRVKIRKFSLLNNILVMEAYFLNPDYSFSILFSGKGSQEEYWSKETDVIDPSWTDRNQISVAPIQYADITGTYSVNQKEWKRVVYIDDLKDNIYPLLTKYELTFEANGNIRLSKLPFEYFGVNIHHGTWIIKNNKVLIDFPLFPFYGNIHKYGNITEIDDLPFYGNMYARHNAGISMEIVKIEQERILVKFTELNICSAYVYLNKI